MATAKQVKVTFPAEIFDAQTNIPLIHQVVVAQLAAARQGTHKTKNRGEVSGSGAKPFKQKGTGRARQGSIRMPQHRGGGVVHGPNPRDYSQRTPKKMIAQALRGVLSDRARADRIIVLDQIVAGDPSTKAARQVIEGIAKGKRMLVVVDGSETNSVLSLRNLGFVHTIEHTQLNAYDVVVSDYVIFTKTAFDAFVESRSAKEVASA
ncbi:MAG TPA: 50S ribosomal protein L4 [Microbacteriaceae bacterium]|nr:50S ribosomal protein L4 [Microbacteriaceae bacterium]